METLIHRRVEACRRGEFEKAICRLGSGWVVLGDVQMVRGYCLLLPDPVVPHLNALDQQARSDFLGDMARLGDALLEITAAARINYEMLGNLEPALHAHLFPRYDTEPESLRTAPIWSYDWGSAPPFDEARDRPLMDEIAEKLRELG